MESIVHALNCMQGEHYVGLGAKNYDHRQFVDGWMTRTWSEPTPTRSWGAATCAAAKADYGSRRTDDQLDLDKIWAIDAKMAAKGWYYDAYLDGSYNVWQLMIEMCQPMLCIPRLEGTIFSVIEDGTDRPARYMLTPRTIRRGTFRITYNT